MGADAVFDKSGLGQFLDYVRSLPTELAVAVAQARQPSGVAGPVEVVRS